MNQRDALLLSLFLAVSYTLAAHLYLEYQYHRMEHLQAQGIIRLEQSMRTTQAQTIRQAVRELFSHPKKE